jgi:hypothetical protein
MTDEQEAKLAALKRRADKLGHQIEPSVKKLGYCLWQSWPGGRLMILGRNDNDGVTLDAIAQKLDEIEAGNHEAGNRPVPAPQGCGPDLEVANHHALARPDTSAPAAATPRSSPRGVDDRRKPLGGAIDELGEAEMAQLYGNRSYH